MLQPPEIDSRTPVSPDELLQVLNNAASQNSTLVQASSTQLASLIEKHTDVLDGMHYIATQRDIPLHIRQQSIIQFKNLGSSHWRSKKLFSDEAKQRIRSRSLTLLSEVDEVISRYNAVIVAKIVRSDYPTQWPSIVPDLISEIDIQLQRRGSNGSLDAQDSIILRRCAEMLNKIFKEFYSFRMLTGVRTMKDLASRYHSQLQSFYEIVAGQFGKILTPESISQPQYSNDICVAHILYKCLIKIVLWCWARFRLLEVNELKAWVPSAFFPHSVIQLRTLYELRVKLILATGSSAPNPVSTRSLDYLTRHVKSFLKMTRTMQRANFGEFITLPGSNDLLLYYWSTVVQASQAREMVDDQLSAVFPTQFVTQALLSFRDGLGQWSKAMDESVLTAQFVEAAVQLLISRFIPLTEEDLNEWLADPEAWVNTEDTESDMWQYELRPCAERVLLSLSQKCPTVVIPLILSALQQVNSIQMSSIQEVLQKEAVYCAVGRCAGRLRSSLDFGQLLNQTLVPEVQNSNPMFLIIKRRIVHLLGQLVFEGAISPENPDVWNIMIHLLKDDGSETSMVARLTAAVSLQKCIVCMDGKFDYLQSRLAEFLPLLVKLWTDVDSTEAKHRVTKSLNEVIDAAGPTIAGYLSSITDPLPQMWTSAQDNMLFKATLLETVSKAVKAAGERSLLLYPIVIPMVLQSFEPGVSVQLDEDALGLWLTTLRCASNLSDNAGVHGRGLGELFPLALNLLANNLDLLGKIISIMQSYFILDADGILQAFGDQLFQAFVNIAKTANHANLKDMICLLELLIQISNPQAWAIHFHSSGLFTYIMDVLMADEEKVPLLTECIYLLARMSIQDPLIVKDLIKGTSALKGIQESLLWEGLLDQWWRRFDNVYEPPHRKLVAMGIADLVRTGQPEVLERLSSEIFNLWIDVFGEIKEAAASDSSTRPVLQAFWLGNGEPPEVFMFDTEGTLEYDRRLQIFRSDPVTCSKLTTYIALRYHHVQNQAGGPQVFASQFLQKADPAVLKQIETELSQN